MSVAISGLTGPINVDPFRRATVIFVLNPTRIRLNFSNREPSRISPVATNPRTETHQSRICFEARKHPEMTVDVIRQELRQIRQGHI